MCSEAKGFLLFMDLDIGSALIFLISLLFLES
jgi:hypothetical protein